MSLKPGRGRRGRNAAVARRRGPLTPEGRKAEQAGWAARSGPVTTTKLSRAEVREVACPRCNARAGEPCKGTRDDRAANHAERIKRRMTQQ